MRDKKGKREQMFYNRCTHSHTHMVWLGLFGRLRTHRQLVDLRIITFMCFWGIMLIMLSFLLVMLRIMLALALAETVRLD